jgi:thiol-disulfide isomerase/thioredoxin
MVDPRHTPVTTVHLSRRHCLAAALAWPTAARAAAEPLPWGARRPTPSLALEAWEGPPVSLAALRGRPVLLNFWASWCEPCRAEMPSLELLATRHEADGLQVLVVNFRETDVAVRRFLEQTAISLPVLRDRDGGAARAFGVRVFPSTVAIGRDGRAVFSVVGEVDWTGPEARRWIAPLLSTPR